MAGTSWNSVDDALLRDWPLPQPGAAADKEERGHVLIVAGSREMPGAAWLAATAALRAGAGKLVVATAASVAAGLALNLPEARVIALPELKSGGLSSEGVQLIEGLLGSVNAVLLGPGWVDPAACIEFARRVVEAIGHDSSLILDAAAMDVASAGEGAEGSLLTPHAGEMAHLLNVSKAEILAHPEVHARGAAQRWNCTVALKGATTFVATADGRGWRHDSQNPGLGTSGSGDTLAGIVAGLAARGAALEQAAVWGVALHARAGAALASKFGPLGYLAGELLAEVPRLMSILGPKRA